MSLAILLNKRRAAAAGYDADAQAYFDAVPNALSSDYKSYINTLVTTLKADGNWNGLDRLWLFANSTIGNAKIDIKGLNSFTEVNSLTFVADQGVTSDGTSYVNTGFNPNTAAGNYSLNSGSIGIYSRTNSATDTYEIAVIDGGIYSAIITRHSSNNLYAGINNATLFNGANTDSRGLFAVMRTAANSAKSYRNGAEVATSAVASSSMPNRNIYVCCGNENGTAVYFSGKQISIAFIGNGTITQSTFYTAIQAYMTSLGTQV